jgi:hypothetical protein
MRARVRSALLFFARRAAFSAERVGEVTIHLQVPGIS